VEFVESGMILGLGSGSTTRFAVKEIGRRMQAGSLKNILGIPSSIQTEKLADQWKIPLTNFEQRHTIDLTIDGADEVDPKLNVIKGGGGALLREKILAQASRRLIIIVDESKLSPQLGTHWPVPVEVIPFAWQLEANYLKSLGAEVSLREKEDQVPFTTDQGNLVLDCRFGPISHPNQLAQKLSQRAGIVEHGLFLGLVSEVIAAGRDGLQHLKRESS